MRMLLSQRLTPEDIGEINVRSSSGQMVPISTMVNVDEKPVLQSINRIDRERSVSVTANVAPGHSQSEALAVVDSADEEISRSATTPCSVGRAVIFKIRCRASASP